MEQFFEEQQIEEQVIVDKPHIFAPDNRLRLESSTMRSSNRASRDLAMYDE